MTPKNSSNPLKDADETLAKIARQLVERPFELACCSHLLSRTTEALRTLIPGTIRPGASSFVPAIRKLQASTARVQQLLDSAANFYCGSICASMPSPEMYNPDGEITRAPAGGHLQLEA